MTKIETNVMAVGLYFWSGLAGSFVGGPHWPGRFRWTDLHTSVSPSSKQLPEAETEVVA
jgi:hypothetical protein